MTLHKTIDGYIYRVTDTHVHPGKYDRFSETIAGIFAKLEARQRPFFEQRLVGQDASALVAYLDAEGIDNVWAMAEDGAPTNYGVPSETVLGFASCFPKRIKAIGNLNPELYPLRQRAAALLDAGVIGFKIYGSDHRISPLDARYRPMLEEVAERGKIVFVHTGSSRFPGAINEFGRVAPLGALFERYPSASFVMCHGGKGGQEDDAIAALLSFPNTFIDTADLPHAKLASMVTEGLADRFLFATDFPQIVRHHEAIERIARLPLSHAAKAKILGGNAERLLGHVHEKDATAGTAA